MNAQKVKEYLQQFNFERLFIEELGWDIYRASLEVLVDGVKYTLRAVAEKRGFVVYVCGQPIPTHSTRSKIEAQVTQSVREHLLIFTDAAQTTQIWQWVRREPGKPTARREHHFRTSQSGQGLIQKLQAIAFSLEEEEGLSLVDVTGGVRAAFDLERVTRRFYDLFKKERDAFHKFLSGISDGDMQRWYVSVMLNRLMFIYFIQKKGFLNGDDQYLRHKLAESQAQGPDRFYRELLCPLFFEGFAKRPEQRSAGSKKLLGQIPYLNGSLFLPHPVELRYGEKIQLADAAFQRLFDFFEQYHWHLDERPLRNDNEINPDVLGYIFEKYINQKQMGAYYTKEDITGYISQNTILPCLLDQAQQQCQIAFEGNPSVWDLLVANPDRYIYQAVKHGADLPLPPEIAAGLEDVARRSAWNQPAPAEYALPTEIWREVVARRQRYETVRARLAAGKTRAINDFITYNLDLRQFAQDVIESCEGPELLRAFYHAIEQVTILDPTVGSGAFLFAALNILEPLYEACLERMASFVADYDLTTASPNPARFSDFRQTLARVAEHPNRRYFIFKSIIVNNLFGVDLMEEAVEICKLRLFLKLVAQVERGADIEPLPDIDFNIRAGNTLVGYATIDEVRRAFTLQGSQMKLLSTEELDAFQQFEEKVADVDRLFQHFRRQQTELGGQVTAEDKQELRRRLQSLEEELNYYLAGEYGVEVKKKAAYDKWRETHQPFHWFIEFYNTIVKQGGFDVIIGNPPYIELTAISEYKTQGYQSIRAGNLYALVIERCLQLRAVVGRHGFIVPVSSISTDRYKPLQDLLSKYDLHYSSYDDRPSRLFDGLEHIRLTIHLIGAYSKQLNLHSTQYNKWSKDERVSLFQKLTYTPSQKVFIGASLPKFWTEIERGIVSKLATQHSKLVSFYSKTGKCPVYYSRKVGYFLQVLNFQPKVLDGGGNLRPPSEFKELPFSNEDYAAAALCCLNSSLFYWFITVFSDCRHVNKREVDLFPVDLSELIASQKDKIHKLADELMNNLKQNSEERTMRFSHDTLTVQCIYPKYSKTIIDEIDRTLALHYGFTPEELDFILNYDIKYRLGSDSLEEDEENDEG